MNKFFKNWHIFLLVLLSLIPIIWFASKSGFLINGVDTNFPLNPNTWIYRRFFVWDALINAGFHFSSTIAGIFFHTIQVIPHVIGLKLSNVELLSFIFWFSAIVFSSWFFAKTIIPKSKISQLILVSLYSLNPYLFNTWENVKVANLALAVSLPLALSFLFLLKETKISMARSLFWAMCIGIIASGAGINPSYILSLFLASLIFSIGLALEDFNLLILKKRVSELAVLWLGIISINLFWIIPTFYYVVTNVPASQSLQGIGFTNWVDSLSQHTSIFNVLRLQGAWDWYAVDNFGFPYYIPYALKYFQNILFLGFSALIPTLVFLSIIFLNNSKRGLYIAFCLMVIVGIFLGTGTHPPTGFLFQFLMNHLPFFGIFRSPWYIFTSFVTIALASLVSLFFNNLFNRNKIIAIIFSILLLVGNLFYNYPLITGKIFRPGRNDSFYVHFPNYVFDALKWVNSNETGRILGYPDDEIEQFKWGYRGVESILQLGSNKEVLYLPLYLTETPTVEIIKDLYLAIKKNQLEVASPILSKLGIKTLFYKEDQKSIRLKLPDSFRKFPYKQFGDWKFYDLSSLNSYGKIYATKNYYFVYPFERAMRMLGGLRADSVVFNPDDTVVNAIPEFYKNSNTVIVAENLQEEAFDKNTNLSALGSNGETDSFRKAVYHFNVQVKEDFNLKLKKNHLTDYGIDPYSSLPVQLNNKRVILEPIKVGDYVEYKDIVFDPGDYVLSFDLDSRNFAINGDFKQTINSVNPKGVEIVDNGTNRYLSVTSTSGEVKASVIVEDFDPLAKYFVSFDYQKLYGGEAGAVVRQSSDQSVFKVQGEMVATVPEWKTHTAYFEPIPANSNLAVELSAVNNKNEFGTKILFDNVKVVRIFTNQLLLVSKEKQIASPAQVEYTKISPVKYEGKVKNISGPHVLVFSENYSNGWELFIKSKNDQKLTKQKIHFTGNSFANGWYVDGIEDEYQFELYYKPQKLFYLGIALTITFLLGSIILYFKKRK